MKFKFSKGKKGTLISRDSNGKIVLVDKKKSSLVREGETWEGTIVELERCFIFTPTKLVEPPINVVKKQARDFYFSNRDTFVSHVKKKLEAGEKENLICLNSKTSYVPMKYRKNDFAKSPLSVLKIKTEVKKKSHEITDGRIIEKKTIEVKVITFDQPIDSFFMTVKRKVSSVNVTIESREHERFCKAFMNEKASKVFKRWYGKTEVWRKYDFNGSDVYIEAKVPIGDFVSKEGDHVVLSLPDRVEVVSNKISENTIVVLDLNDRYVDGNFYSEFAPIKYTHEFEIVNGSVLPINIGSVIDHVNELTYLRKPTENALAEWKDVYSRFTEIKKRIESGENVINMIFEIIDVAQDFKKSGNIEQITKEQLRARIIECFNDFTHPELINFCKLNNDIAITMQKLPDKMIISTRLTCMTEGMYFEDEYVLDVFDDNRTRIGKLMYGYSSDGYNDDVGNQGNLFYVNFEKVKST